MRGGACIYARSQEQGWGARAAVPLRRPHTSLLAGWRRQLSRGSHNCHHPTHHCRAPLACRAAQLRSCACRAMQLAAGRQHGARQWWYGGSAGKQHREAVPLCGPHTSHLAGWAGPHIAVAMAMLHTAFCMAPQANGATCEPPTPAGQAACVQPAGGHRSPEPLA